MINKDMIGEYIYITRKSYPLKAYFYKDKKVIIYKKRRRKDSKLKRGFRRQFTKVKVLSIKA